MTYPRGKSYQKVECSEAIEQTSQPSSTPGSTLPREQSQLESQSQPQSQTYTRRGKNMFIENISRSHTCRFVYLYSIKVVLEWTTKLFHTNTNTKDTNTLYMDCARNVERIIGYANSTSALSGKRKTMVKTIEKYELRIMPRKCWISRWR